MPAPNASEPPPAAPAVEAPAATAPPQPFRVEFSSSTSCRDANEFTRWLRSFTARVRPAEPGEPAFTFVVQLVPTEAGVGGRLTLREADGRETLREVPSPNCHDVVLGMALIAALTIDPLATIPADLRVANPPAAEPPPAPPRERRPPPPDEPSPWHVAVGARATVHGAVAPDPAWGAAVFASASYDSGDVFAPTARLAAHYASSTADGFAGGSAAFTWLAARLSLCPVEWVPGAAVSLRPCAFADAGRLGSDAEETFGGDEPQSVFWSAAGVELELEAALGPLVLGAEAGAFTPFRRDVFYFGGTEVVHEIPAVGITASAGVGVRFF